MRHLIFILTLTLSSLFSAGFMSNYYVSPTGTGTCQISDPCGLQSALFYSEIDDLDNTIHLSAGIYDLSNGALTYDVNKTDSLTIDGDSAATTILNANYANSLLRIERKTLIDDSTVTITIRNLTFTKGSDNSLNGNGLYINIYRATVIIEDSRFIGNGSNDGNGGGIYVLSNDNASIRIKRNIFRDNHGDAGGGAYLYTYAGSIWVVDNEFTNNSVSSMLEHNGGGLYVDIVSGTSFIIQNIFSSNSAINSGGALYSKVQGTGIATINNNTAVDNSADTSGGGIYIDMSITDSSTTSLSNNIIWGNSGGAGHDLYVNNNGSSIDGATCNLRYNIFGSIGVNRTTHFTNEFNIMENPRLAGSHSLIDGRRSIRPFSGSPAIDNGSGCVSGLSSTDFEGGDRFVNNVVNIGAVEAIVPIMPPIYYLLLN